jgi:hypothetical protein
MPITYPIIEEIARELYRRLNLMVGSANYQTKVREVIRPKRLNSYSPSHLQIVMTEGTTEQVEELTYPGNPVGIAYRTVFNLHLHLMPDENSSRPIDTDSNQFAADVVKAVTTPYSSWHTFDQNAIDAAWRAKEQVTSDGIDGVTLPLEVLYRVYENDPYTTRI